jgi:hypothetical protein
VIAGEAEKTLPASTFRTFSPDHSLEVPFLGTCMMLDGYIKRYNPACIAIECSKYVIVIGVSMGSDLFSGERLQFGERSLTFHFFLPPF